MRVRYTPRALADLDDIFSYLDQRAPVAAQSVKTAILRSIERLADFPSLGQATEVPQVGELILVRYPYKIYYSVEDDEVTVIHIRDARRRSWLD